MKKIVGVIIGIGVVSGCVTPPNAMYYNRGNPETLLDVSTEVVNMNMATRDHLSELSNMVVKDPPSRAELGCLESDLLCSEARRALAKQGVPVMFVDSGKDVSLVYQRVMLRDCDPRYFDNSHNPHNLPPATFGCANAANMAQQVSNKRQFVSPALMDLPDAEKASQHYQEYRQETSPVHLPPPSKLWQPSE